MNSADCRGVAVMNMASLRNLDSDSLDPNSIFSILRKNKLARFIADFNNNNPQKKKPTLKGDVVNEPPFLHANCGGARAAL